MVLHDCTLHLQSDWLDQLHVWKAMLADTKPQLDGFMLMLKIMVIRLGRAELCSPFGGTQDYKQLVVSLASVVGQGMMAGHSAMGKSFRLLS